MAISKDLEETSANVTQTSGFVLTSVLTAHLLTLLTGHLTYEERRGREWSRREPSDIDEAPEGELAGASESIEPARRKKASSSNETERNIEAGAGIEPANSGFADRDLTTWLPRRCVRANNIVVAALVSSADRRSIDIRRGESLYNFSDLGVER